MIYTAQGEPVEIIGGPYRRLLDSLGIGFYVETYRVRSLENRAWTRYRPLDGLKADGGVQEIIDAAAVVNER